MTLKIKINISKFRVEYLLVYLFFGLTLVIYLFSENSIIIYFRYVILMIGAIDGYYISLKKRFNYPFYLAIFLSLCWILCWIFQSSLNLSLRNFSYTIWFIGFSVLLLEEFFEIWGCSILFLICAGTVTFRYLRGINPNSLLTHNSRNFISVLLLFTLLLYYLALIKSKNEKVLFWLLPAIIFFGLSTVAYGRGGILTSGFLLCALIIYRSLKTDKLRAKRGLRIAVIIIVALIIIYLVRGTQIMVYLSRYLGKFAVSVVDEERIKIWSSFFRNNVTSFRDFIFGSDASLARFDGNLHNAFLQCYASYGLVAICVLIVLLVRSFIYGIKNREYLWAILMATLMLRAFTDKLFFQGYCELFLYYFLMYGRHKVIANRRTNS